MLPKPVMEADPPSSSPPATAKPPLEKATDYVFGYGSLICPKSRLKTVKRNKTGIPVVVQGLARVWSKRSTVKKITCMGVQFCPGESCVGVMVPVSLQMLDKLDLREKGYDRVLLKAQDIGPVEYLMAPGTSMPPDDEESTAKDPSPSLEADKNGDDDDDDDDYYHQNNQTEFFHRKDDPSIKYWVYVPQNPLPPNPDYPIAQSYVDTILRGCLTISDDFAKDFIETTKGWNPEEIKELGLADEEDGEDGISTDGNETSFDEQDEDNDDDDDDGTVWINDRHRPLYGKGDQSFSLRKAKEFDKLLKTHRPRSFKERQKLVDTTVREDESKLWQWLLTVSYR